MYSLFKGCGKRMCDQHCSKQYGDQHNMRLTNWHCNEPECSDRFYQAQKKCCLIAFFTFLFLFCLIGIVSFSGSDKYDVEMGLPTNNTTAISAEKWLHLLKRGTIVKIL